jgi:hypothetical protein
MLCITIYNEGKIKNMDMRASWICGHDQQGWSKYVRIDKKLPEQLSLDRDITPAVDALINDYCMGQL